MTKDDGENVYEQATFDASGDPIVLATVASITELTLDSPSSGKVLTRLVLYTIDRLYAEARQDRHMKALIGFRNEVAAAFPLVLPKGGSSPESKEPQV